MGEVAYTLQGNTESPIEIVVHVDESLSEGQRSGLVSTLENAEGIDKAEFCTLRNHLMLVKYDRNRMTSQEVLGRVTSQSIHAELVGPV